MDPITRQRAAASPGLCRQQILDPDGALILIDKPYGETSFHVVNKVRQAISRQTGIKRVKVGHAGTLDPLSTGLLVLATRAKTKSLSSLLGLPKSYVVTMRFGIHSDSFDLERPIKVMDSSPQLQEAQVQSVLEGFLGEQAQVPPVFSAVKQQGKPVYHAARRGDTITLDARQVEVYAIELLQLSMPNLIFRVECSKGTYVRALVRDIAERLGTWAVMTGLHRDSIDGWRAMDALSLTEAIDLISEN